MLPDWHAWPRVELEGRLYAVAPHYIAGVAIGEAVAQADSMGCPLPWPALVDAIWKAADCKIDAATLTRRPGPDMGSDATLLDQAERVARRVAAWARVHGREPHLVAGTHKDVVRTTAGVVGLYGWQKAPSGARIQGLYTRHAPSWRDYSQGWRVVIPLGAVPLV